MKAVSVDYSTVLPMLILFMAFGRKIVNAIGFTGYR